MRRFELTVGVFLGDDTPLPNTFNQWITAAGLAVIGSSPTTLERVVEIRYPPSKDVVGKRKGLQGPWV